MAQVFIYTDETYHSMIYPVREVGGAPRYYLPVEIPDSVLAAYETAVAVERTLRNQIIKTWGESDINPNYEAEWQTFMAKTQDDEIVDRYAEDELNEWAEYLGDDDR